MSSQSVSFIDMRVEETFKKHLSVNDEEVSNIVNRFYELYYTRGKPLRTSINSALIGNPAKSPIILFDELRDIVSRF